MTPLPLTWDHFTKCASVSITCSVSFTNTHYTSVHFCRRIRCIETHIHAHTERHVELNKAQWQLGKIAPINHLSARSKICPPYMQSNLSPQPHTLTHTRSEAFILLGWIRLILDLDTFSHKHISWGLYFLSWHKAKVHGYFFWAICHVIHHR